MSGILIIEICLSNDIRLYWRDFSFGLMQEKYILFSSIFLSMCLSEVGLWGASKAGLRSVRKYICVDIRMMVIGK